MLDMMLAHGDGVIFGPFSLWTFVLRFGQSLLDAAPGLLVGVLLAGILETRGGRRWITAALAGPLLQCAPRAMLLGLLAPVGALGTLPVATALLRANVRPAIVLLLVVMAPAFTPWSLGYAADLMGLVPTAVALVSTILLAFSVSIAVQGARTGPNNDVMTPDDGSGSQLLVALRASARHCAGPLAIYAGVGLGASASFAAFLEPGAIEAHLGESAVTTMFELAVPLSFAHVQPELAVVFAGEFWRIGALVGATLIAFMLGAAWNPGTMTWMIHRFGRVGVLATSTWIALALALAVVGNFLLEAPRPGEADAHAFDMLTKPYHFGGESPGSGVAQQLGRTPAGNGIALLILGALSVTGLLLRIGHRRGSGRSGGAVQPEARPVNPIGIRLAMAGGLLICVVASAYSYFPPPAELNDRIDRHSGNLFEAVCTVESGAPDEAQRTAARRRALNALDRIESDLSRYVAACVLRGIPSTGNSPGAIDAVRHFRLQMEASATGLPDAALELADRLKRLAK